MNLGMLKQIYPLPLPLNSQVTGAHVLTSLKLLATFYPLSSKVTFVK